MPALVECDCGAKLRVPDEALGRAVRCPKCKATIKTNDSKASAGSPRRGKARSLGITGECPICQIPVATDDYVIACPDCRQIHHQDCWNEMGGCSTYGCKKAPSTEKVPEQADRPQGAWGDYKNCPMCGEQIPSIALQCRFCHTNFDTVDPLTVADLHRKLQKGDMSRSAEISVIALFVVSLIGCLAPIIAVVGLAWVIPKRSILAKAGPFYVVLGYSSIVVSLLYSLLMFIFGVASLANR